MPFVSPGLAVFFFYTQCPFLQGKLSSTFHREQQDSCIGIDGKRGRRISQWLLNPLFGAQGFNPVECAEMRRPAGMTRRMMQSQKEIENFGTGKMDKKKSRMKWMHSRTYQDRSCGGTGHTRWCRWHHHSRTLACSLSDRSAGTNFLPRPTGRLLFVSTCIQIQKKIYINLKNS